MIIINKYFIINIDNIDTDLIIPKQFLNTINNNGFYFCLFYDFRYILINKKLYNNNDFEINKIYNKKKILISKKNFGCGSSREHAIWALKDFGINIIILESYSDIFYENSLKNNLLLVKLKFYEINYIIKLFNNNNYNNIICINIKKQFIYINNIYIYFYINNFIKLIFLKNFSLIDFILENKKLIIFNIKK